MDYDKVLFTKGLNCEAYREIDNGIVVRYCDMDGNTITIPEVTESHISDINPPRPVWAIPLSTPDAAP